MEAIHSKEVKIRKDRRCWGCKRVYAKGTEMKTVTCVDGGEINKAYWCNECVEFMNTLDYWEKEDGFAEGDLLNYEEYNNRIKAAACV